MPVRDRREGVAARRFRRCQRGLLVLTTLLLMPTGCARVAVQNGDLDLVPGATEGGDLLPSDAPSYARLALEGEPGTVSADSDLTIGVRYALLDSTDGGAAVQGFAGADAPVSGEVGGVELQFALEGDPQGSSLEQTSVLTDARGKAAVQLRVGDGGGSFSVRISGPGAESVFAQVLVVRNDGELSLEVTYEGQREVGEWRVAVLAEMGCQQALAMPLEEVPVYVLTGDEDQEGAVSAGVTGRIDGLRFDTSYALVVSGQAPSGPAVAQGCLSTSLQADLDNSTVVPVLDLPLSLQGDYVLSAVFDLGEVLGMLGQFMLERGRMELRPGIAGGVGRYLNAVQEALASTRGPEVAVEFEQALAAEEGLLEEGQQALLTAGGAPDVALEWLAGQFFVQGRNLELSGRVTSVAGFGLTRDIMLDSVVARGSTGLESLSGDDPSEGLIMELPQSSLVFALLDSSRGQLKVQSWGIDLALGSYGQALLMLGATGPDAAVWRERFLEAGACGAFADWLGSASVANGYCDGDCAQAACESVLYKLRDSMAAALLEFDQSYARLEMAGVLPALDVDADIYVDRFERSEWAAQWSAGDAQPDGFELSALVEGDRFEGETYPSAP